MPRLQIRLNSLRRDRCGQEIEVPMRFWKQSDDLLEFVQLEQEAHFC